MWADGLGGEIAELFDQTVQADDALLDWALLKRARQAERLAYRVPQQRNRDEREHYVKHRDAITARNRARYASDAEAAKAKARARFAAKSEAQREELKARNAARYAANREAMQQASRAAYAAKSASAKKKVQ